MLEVNTSIRNKDFTWNHMRNFNLKFYTKCGTNHDSWGLPNEQLIFSLT